MYLPVCILDYILLDLILIWGNSGVQSCISSFFNESSMEKTCQLCSQNIEHKQKTRLEKIPRVLIVHFQRLTPKWDEKTVRMTHNLVTSLYDVIFRNNFKRTKNVRQLNCLVLVH